MIPGAEPRHFPHQHSGHCESGTISALLRDRGLDLSEPMWFGLGSGLLFLHTSLIKVGGLPLTSYRGAPLSIVRTACRRLGIPLQFERFRNQDEATRRLQALLAQGVSVGLQTCVFWLPYFPPDMRFQFNGHNLVAFADAGDGFWLSDPVFEHPVLCPADALRRARFAKGAFAPRGLLYYPAAVPGSFDLRVAVRDALRTTCRRMLHIPWLPVGVRGIRVLAAKVRTWPERLGEEQARACVTQVVRMQEEIGTGGAGFRFLFAAFLRESGERLHWPLLANLSVRMTQIGDEWRQFALLGAQICKGTRTGQDGYDLLSEQLRRLAEAEEALFRTLQDAL